MTAYAREQAERAERIRAMKLSNHTIDEMAEALDLSTDAIKNHLRKLGLTGSVARSPLLHEHFDLLRRVNLNETRAQMNAGSRVDRGVVGSRLRTLRDLGLVSSSKAPGHAQAKTWMITDAGRAALAEYRRSKT